MIGGCGGAPPADDRQPPAEERTGAAPVATLSESRFGNAAGRPGLVAAVQGIARIGYLRPQTSQEGGELVTTIRIKNLDDGVIAGFTVEEVWYDAIGEPVTGTTYRHRQPFLPGDIIDVTLRIEATPDTARNAHTFRHQGGDISLRVLETLEDPP